MCHKRGLHSMCHKKPTLTDTWPLSAATLNPLHPVDPAEKRKEWNDRSFVYYSTLTANRLKRKNKELIFQPDSDTYLAQ